MAYCTLSDVQKSISRFPITNDSQPTASEVESIISGIAADIDLRLSMHDVSTPVTSPPSFTNWLREVNTWGATASVLKVMFPGAAGPGSNPAFQFWETRYQNALKLLEDGSVLPSELSEASGYIGPTSYFKRNPDVEEFIGSIAEPWITRRREF